MWTDLPIRRATVVPAIAAAVLAVITGAAVAPDPVGAASAPGGATVQGERFALTPGAGMVVADARAAAGSALLIWSNGTATASLTTTSAATLLTARVRGDQCNGAPAMTLRVDGKTVATTAVPQSTWTAASARGSWVAGTHTVSVAFTNDVKTAACDRNLRLDQVTLDATATTPQPPGPVVTNPLAGARFWVDPASQARQEIPRRAGNASAVAALNKIADQSNAEWYGDWVPASGLQSRVASRTGLAAAAGAVPVLVTYAIPGRDCGSYSAGGLSGPPAYAAWIRAFAAGLGGRKAVVVVEPDALAQLDCLSATARADRMAMLRDALTVLRSAPGAATYLDAGNSGWISADVMAPRLREAGIATARGFAVNVSNFNWTASEVTFGNRLTALLGGAHYVVDTSRNGLGPLGGNLGWCNPAGRALGTRPTTSTASAAADAYLWIKKIGQSDGDCGRGEPAAGSWWADYAIGLGSRAAW